MKDRIASLRDLLEAAVKRSCVKDTGCIYSSGIDSALIAFIASRHCTLHAYTVGGRGSSDMECARKSRGDAPFEIKTIEIDAGELEGILPELVKIVGLPDPLKVSVGVPMYCAAREACRDGLSVVLSGQGGDELFGGYNRYLPHAAKGDHASLKAAMQKDADNAYADNLDRDSAIFRAFGIDLRFPYMDADFSRRALETPSELKVYELAKGAAEEFACVDSVDDKRFIRKYLLRHLAAEAGLPRYILDRKKKAAQYGSESEKLIEQIARKNGYRKKASEAGRTDYVRMYLESIV